MMSNKKRLLAIGLASFVLIACSGDDDSADSSSGNNARSVVFFAYEDTFLPDVLIPFKKSTGIVVNTPAFADEDEIETKLRAGFKADVVELCAGEVSSMIESNLLQTIDPSRIKDWGAIFDSFKQGEGVVSPAGDIYIVPLNGGPFGIVYLADEVATPIKSYKQFFSSGLGGDIAVNSEPVSTIWDMANSLGYGPEVKNISNDQVVEAVDALIALDTIRTTWSNDGDLIQLFAAGEIVAANHTTPEIAVKLQEVGINAVYVAPEEGQIMWSCGLGISANATHVDAAYELINHYLDPNMQLIVSREYIYFASNSRILEVASPDLVEELSLADPGSSEKPGLSEALPDDELFWDEQWGRFGG